MTALLNHGASGWADSWAMRPPDLTAHGELKALPCQKPPLSVS